MSVPYPIVKVPNLAARCELVRQLVALGCNAPPFAPDHDATGDRPYVCLLKLGSHHSSISYAEQIEVDQNPLGKSPRYWGHSMTLVNSPTHFLSYVRRHILKPKDQSS